MASLDAAQAMAHDWKSHEIELPYESLLSAKDDLRRLPGILLLEDLVKGAIQFHRITCPQARFKSYFRRKSA